MDKTLEIVATFDALESGGAPIVDDKKLHKIYDRLRREVFRGDPIQDNSGNNGLVLHDKFHGHSQGNYGWQLFKFSEGTAMLEYLGQVSYWGHERKPLPLEEERSLRYLSVTFHQKGPTFTEAKRVFDEEIQLAKDRLERTHS